MSVKNPSQVWNCEKLFLRKLKIRQLASSKLARNHKNTTILY